MNESVTIATRNCATNNKHFLGNESLDTAYFYFAFFFLHPTVHNIIILTIYFWNIQFICIINTSTIMLIKNCAVISSRHCCRRVRIVYYL